jgi:hypothetical protein
VKRTRASHAAQETQLGFSGAATAQQSGSRNRSKEGRAGGALAWKRSRSEGTFGLWHVLSSTHAPRELSTLLQSPTLAV